MASKLHYVSHKNHIVIFDSEEMSLVFKDEEISASAKLYLDGLYEGDRMIYSFKEYSDAKIPLTLGGTTHSMLISFIPQSENMPAAEMVLSVDSRGISFKIREIDHYIFRARGEMSFGKVCDLISIDSSNTPTTSIHSSLGPATAKYDNAIYNAKLDTAFAIEGIRCLDLFFDREKECYAFRLATKSEGVAEVVRFEAKRDILKQRYDIEFAPIKKRGKYNTPPAGFMTWYSLKFDTCEERVLKNVAFMKDHLKEFGANTVWIDWEWCHRRYERERFDGVDNFNPDPEKYPHGLGFMADKIKDAGFIPALWLGFTNDPSYTEYEREHPEISLSHHDTWSGRYYYDITEPEYLNGYLPKAIAQVKDWGYEAVKYDTLPNCITAHEKYHANMSDPTVSTYRAYRGMIEKTRELLGEDFYMLACGSAEEVILWGSDVFDASRIGPDLFTWEKFVETVGRARKYYAMHGIAMYNDPDCVVLRDEYSNENQARARLAFVSLLGMPLNFGDDLTALPKEKIDLLKRALPTLPIRSKSFSDTLSDNKLQFITLHISREFEKYAVAAIMNLTDETRSANISFGDTLRLHDAEYIAYDYFEDKLLGISDSGISTRLQPYETKVIILRPHLARPQLLSTSRHLSSGAAEISNITWSNEENMLVLQTKVIKNDNYCIKIFVPRGYEFKSANLGSAELCGNMLSLSYLPERSSEATFKISFSRR